METDENAQKHIQLLMKENFAYTSLEVLGCKDSCIVITNLALLLKWILLQSILGHLKIEESLLLHEVLPVNLLFQLF